MTDTAAEWQRFLDAQAVTMELSDMEGKEVIIHTCDIGADKQIGYFELPHEDNPARNYDRNASGSRYE